MSDVLDAPQQPTPQAEPAPPEDRCPPIAPRDRRFYTWLVLITGAGLAWRVVYIWVWRRDMVVWGDGYFYHNGSILIAEGKGWINPFAYYLKDTVNQAADHPPAYLLFLAGVSWLGGTGVTPHLLASAVLGSATVFVSGLAGRQFGGARIGLIGAVLVAFYPNVWRWDGLLLSETMAIFAVALTVWLAYRFWRSPNLYSGAVLGAAVGLAALSRAELILLSVLVVVPLCLLVRTVSWAKRIGWLAAAGAACVMVLSPWVAFNLTRFDQPVLLSNGFEITLATSTCDYTFYGPTTGYWSLQCSLDYLAKNGFDEATGDQTARGEILRREALDYLSNQKRRLPIVVLARWGRITGLWNPVQQAELDEFNERETDWVPKAGGVIWYPMAAAAIAGAVLLRRRRIPVMPLVAPPIIVMVIVTMFFGQARYRAIAEGAIALLAAVTIDALVRWFRARGSPGSADDQPGQPAATASSSSRRGESQAPPASE